MVSTPFVVSEVMDAFPEKPAKEVKAESADPYTAHKAVLESIPAGKVGRIVLTVPFKSFAAQMRAAAFRMDRTVTLRHGAPEVNGGKNHSVALVSWEPKPKPAA